MQIHADLNKAALVHSDQLAWIPSPLKGVSRRMLERDGDEVARATTIVAYEPGSYFSRHTHTGGEEFLVLDGVFSDEHGDFPKGMYVRNPIGSSHKPHSKDGCVIMVKLWQMPEVDQEWVRVNTLDFSSYERRFEGVSVLSLHKTSFETVEMWHLMAGGEVPAMAYSGGIELFVACGQIETEEGALSEQDWLRLPVGANAGFKSRKGGLVLVKRGHLDKKVPGPNGA